MQVIRPAVNLAVGPMRVCTSDMIVCMELASEVELRAVRSLARFVDYQNCPGFQLFRPITIRVFCCKTSASFVARRERRLVGARPSAAVIL